jgi:hypothetical protein
VQLNKGRRGIPLTKLSKVAQETLKFLSMVHKDAELPGNPEGWLAVNFGNDSVDFDCECYQDVELPDVRRTNNIFRGIMTNDRKSDFIRRMVRPSTRRQYSKIAAAIEPDEEVVFGLFTNGDVEPEENYGLSKSTAYQIELELPTTADYYGEIQGTIHALYRDDRPRRVVIRELSTMNLIDCFFEDALYNNVIEVLGDIDGVVFIEGEVREDLAKGIVETLNAKAFRLAPPFDEERFSSLIGSAPDLTGKLSTEEYIERFRTNGDS